MSDGKASDQQLPAYGAKIIDLLPIVHRNEWFAAIFAFCWFMLLMAGYYMLRPLRESMGSGLGRQEISRLFLYTFVVMLVLVPVYSHLVTRVPRRILIHLVFHFLAANLLAFAFAQRWIAPDSRMLARIYFVWVSVFGLFAVSVFWSVLTDLFSNEQGKRLFGLISSGATIGGLLGSFVARQFAEQLGTFGLLVVVFVLMESGMIFASLLQRQARKIRLAKTGQQIETTIESELSEQESEDTGASDDTISESAIQRALSGLREIMRSPYLIMICVYFALISVCGTVIYMQLAGVAEAAIPDPDRRTSFFAGLNFWVQLGTLIMQTLLIGPIMRKLGLSVALMILPAVYLIGFVLLSIDASLLVLGLVDIARRIAVYGATSPSREVLFTVVSRRAKYAAKNLMDTVLIRGTDSVTSGLFVQLSKVLSVSYFGFLMVPFTLAWLTVGWMLGRQQSQRLAVTHDRRSR